MHKCRSRRGSIFEESHRMQELKPKAERQPPEGPWWETCRQSNGPENPARKEDDSSDQLQHPAHRNSNHPKREQDQPNKWIENQRQKRQWPAQHQKNAQQEKLHHSFSTSSRSGLRSERFILLREPFVKEYEPTGAAVPCQPFFAFARVASNFFPS